MILSESEYLIYTALKSIPFQTLQRKIYLEKIKIYNRPLDSNEYILIQQYKEHKISFDQLLFSCKWRTKESLEFFIKNM